MKQETLRWLVCPRKEEARPCRGTLQVEQVMSDWDEDPQESLEAILRCDGCETTYPVVCGIPILMDELPQYLRRNYYFIVGHCRAQGGLSDEMKTALLNYVLLDLKTGEEELFPTARRYNRETQLGFLTGIGPLTAITSKDRFQALLGIFIPVADGLFDLQGPVAGTHLLSMGTDQPSQGFLLHLCSLSKKGDVLRTRM